jgi:hypothetical protein
MVPGPKEESRGTHSLDLKKYKAEKEDIHLMVGIEARVSRGIGRSELRRSVTLLGHTGEFLKRAAPE